MISLGVGRLTPLPGTQTEPKLRHGSVGDGARRQRVFIDGKKPSTSLPPPVGDALDDRPNRPGHQTGRPLKNRPLPPSAVETLVSAQQLAQSDSYPSFDRSVYQNRIAAYDKVERLLPPADGEPEILAPGADEDILYTAARLRLDFSV